MKIRGLLNCSEKVVIPKVNVIDLLQEMTGMTSLIVMVIATVTLLPTSIPTDLAFTRSVYRASIPENSVSKTYVTTEEKMGVYLTRPSLQQVQYRIVSGDPDKIFKVEERVVGNFLFLLIRTRTGNSVVLNRERKDSYLLGVKASLTYKDVIIENNTIVSVAVSDTNDLRPLFYQTSYQVDVPEDLPLHRSVVRIHADDPDLGKGGQVYYRFRASNSHLAIHPITGIVTLTRLLRYSEKLKFEVTVFAQNRGDRVPPSAARLTVTVQQVNLHDPEIFVKTVESMCDMTGTDVYATVTVADKDDGSSGEVDRLEIFDGDYNGHFRVRRVSSPNNKTAEYNVISYKMLHKCVYNKRYNLTLIAYDCGRPPRQSLHSFNIRITPPAQRYPIFEKEIYEINVLESAPINSPIIRLKIMENERVVEVHLEIVGGNEEGVFSIHSRTGVLYTARHLDAESKNLYTLTVSAVEHGKPSYSMQTSAKVIVNVLDINDNDPMFELAAMDVSVGEDEPPGTSVARVFAKDNDSGENSYISYSIANVNPVPFEIDHFTGVIRTIDELDYETMKKESLLYVRASDWGLPYRRETEMELKITLRDINDNRPRFDKVNCSGSLSRFAPLRSEIVSLLAIDFDSGSVISYRIVSKNTEGCFGMDLTSGILYVACDLKSENFTERTINTIATDGLHYSEINPIHVKLVNSSQSRGFKCTETDAARQLKDMLNVAAKSNMERVVDQKDVAIMPKRYGDNIYDPEILNLPAIIRVNETVPLGTRLLRVKARDRDLGYNGKLVFGVSSGDQDSLFRLDPETGVLKTIGHLDYEKETEFKLDISVYDLGRPQKSSISILTIVVLDNNDNAPKFEQPLASLSISENTPNGTAVFKAIATDMDSAEYARIRYTLMSDTDVFAIHPTTGVLCVNKSPDREQKDLFEIRIKATDSDADKGVVGLHSMSAVVIRVTDVNDNAPRFLTDYLEVKAKEDLPEGSLITVLETIDEDLGESGEVLYSTDTNQSFTIDRLSGAVTITKALDYEEKSQHDISVVACDRGVPALCASAVLTIIVVDVNENMHAPQFDDVAVASEVKENLPPGARVTVVQAHDSDPPGEDSRLSYYIVDGDGVGYFSIDDQG